MKKKTTKINLNKTKKKNYLTLFDYKINAEILHWGGGGIRAHGTFTYSNCFIHEY